MSSAGRGPGAQHITRSTDGAERRALEPSPSTRRGSPMTAEPVPCRRCGAPTRLVIDAKSRKGVLVDAVPRQDYVIVGATKEGVPLVELREAWDPHFATCRSPGEHE